ncbi:hypothetical protein [uncultured Brevundimonas sp.]|uniref:hypothetical protein n=1 Tax=uncultured Brevundimonas sp. TaxID=213418 RepID=UPI002624E67C|nr:hypothetical protein [uncultured Brevundimonas sp.]
MTQEQLRRPAAMWLAVTTLFGLAGTVVGLLPVVLTWGLFREGQIGLAQVMGTMIPYVSLMICPLVAWWLLLRRHYLASLVVATPPILMWCISIIVQKLS